MARNSRLCSFRAIIIVAMLLLTLSRAKGKELPNNGKIAPSILDHENASFWSNEMVVDEDHYYLGHSGYLHDSTSMLMYQMKNHTTESNKSSLSPGDRGHRRSKRGVTHLYNMIICATGCNPLAYKGYGCYCGFLGSGYPMDGIDRCCKMHDWCYNVAECPMFVEYFVPYYWKCYRGYKPICAIEHGEWGSSGSCAQRLCECDRAFAECLRRYRCPRHKAVCTSSPWRLIQNLFMII